VLGQASQLHKYVEDHGWTVVDDAEKTVAVLTAGSSSRLPRCPPAEAGPEEPAQGGESGTPE
jgi:hypothetical protein